MRTRLFRRAISLGALFGIEMGVAACADTIPTQPQGPGNGSPVRTSAVDPALSTSASSLCVSYGKERQAARAALSRNPTDVDLKASVLAYDAVIADACN